MAQARTSRWRWWSGSLALAVLLVGIVAIVVLVRDEPGSSIRTAEATAPAGPSIEGGGPRGGGSDASRSPGRAHGPAARDTEAPAPVEPVPGGDAEPSATDGESGAAARLAEPALPDVSRVDASSPTAGTAEAAGPTPAERHSPPTVAFGADGRPAVAPPVSDETRRAAPPSDSAPIVPIPEEKGGESVPSEVAVVRLVPSADEIEVGDPVSVTVHIAAAQDVGHAPFHVSFDPGVLRFERGEEGPFLSSDGTQTAFLAAPTSDGAAVVVGLSRLGRVAGASGAGVLCTLHFVAVGPGNANLAFANAKVRDSTNDIVPAHFGAASMRVR